MRWKRPHHTRWLTACLLALLISTVAGGLSFRVATVFAVIFFTGAALLNLDDPDDPDDYPDEEYDYPEPESAVEDAEDEVTEDDVTKDDVTEDDVTKDDVTEDDVTKDDVTKD